MSEGEHRNAIDDRYKSIIVFQVCFDLFDTKKQDYLSADDLGEIMRAMGFRPSEEELQELLVEIDEDGSGEIEFGEFCQLCATFLVEDPDMDTMKRELKDAFRYQPNFSSNIIKKDYLLLQGFMTKRVLATFLQIL